LTSGPAITDTFKVASATQLAQKATWDCSSTG
jgi:hypothetical protein